MNPQDDSTALPEDLRWRLRGLRQDVDPPRDLWDGVAARIAASTQSTPAAPPLRSRRHPAKWFAMAAVLVLAVGMGWQFRPDGGKPPVAHDATVPATPAGTLLAEQADAMSREYETALRQVEAARGVDATPAVLAELDASVATIRAALALAPDSRFLFDRLQRVYAQRLALTQRLVSA